MKPVTLKQCGLYVIIFIKSKYCCHGPWLVESADAEEFGMQKADYQLYAD